MLVLGISEECIHAKYGSPGESSFFRYTAGSHRQAFFQTIYSNPSEGEGQLKVPMSSSTNTQNILRFYTMSSDYSKGPSFGEIQKCMRYRPVLY